MNSFAGKADFELTSRGISIDQAGNVWYMFDMKYFNYDGDNCYFQEAWYDVGKKRYYDPEKLSYIVVDGEKIVDLATLSQSNTGNNYVFILGYNTSEDKAASYANKNGGYTAGGTWYNSKLGNVRVALNNPYNGDNKSKWIIVGICLQDNNVEKKHKIGVVGHWRRYSDKNIVDINSMLNTTLPTCTPITGLGSYGSFSRSNGKVNYSIPSLPSVANSKDDNSQTVTWQYNVRACKSNPSDPMYNNKGNFIGSAWGSWQIKSGSSTQSFTANNYEPVIVYPRIELQGDKISFWDKSNAMSPLYFSRNWAADTISGYPRPNQSGGGDNESKSTSAMRVITQDAYTKKVLIQWTPEIYDSKHVNTEGRWYIFRKETGKPETQVKLGDVSYQTCQFTYADKDLKYGTQYTYTVCFVPTGWTVNSEADASGLSCYVRHTLERDFAFSDLTTTCTTKDITFSWNHSSISDATGSNSYALTIQRCIGDVTSTSTWNDVATINITSKNTTSGSYVESTDKNKLELYETYNYRLKLTVQDSDFVSDYKDGALTGTSVIKEFTASRGSYSNSVKLQWSVDQIGSNTTYFVLQRRPLGSTDDGDYVTIHTTSGISRVYSYDDQSASTGSYYEYRIKMYAIRDDKEKGVHLYHTDGFSNATGVLSGRVYYDSGTAVSGVKILLTPNDADNESLNQFRSLNITSAGAGLKYECTNAVLKKLLNGKDLSFQMYLNPNSGLMNTDGQAYNVLDITSTLGIVLKYQKDKNSYLIGAYGNDGTASYSTLSIQADSWSHISVTFNQSTGTFTAYTASATDIKSSQIATGKKAAVNANAKCIALGNKANFNSSNSNFRGFVDEFRLFTKELSVDEISKNYSHTLSGSESSLAIYWPMDEGLSNQTLAYDFSKTNDIGNGRHAKVVVSAKSSMMVPSEDQLSLSSYTDVDGNYVVRGIPFSGDGTNYVITPVLGVHEFSASSSSRFFSRNSLVQSGVDFKDVSSFKVRGSVYYKDSNIPVKGAYLYVDGTPCSINNEIVTTDENGEYTISVPIGDHYVSVGMSGHTFVDNGRYPADPDGVNVKATFISERSNLTFYDNTTVTVAGRVVGGDIENAKPLGFGESKNNLGRAKITLQLGDGQSLAMKVVQKGTTYSFENADADINVDSPVSSVNSTAVRKRIAKGTSYSEVEIITDSLTGEFAALLPPLEYNIKSVQLINDNKLVFTLPQSTIDASDATASTTDTLVTNSGAKEYFTYNSKLMLKYISEPQFTIYDETAGVEGMYGEPVISLNNATGGKDKVQIFDKTKKKYNYSYPVYQQYGSYDYSLKVYEKYINVDAKSQNSPDSVDNVPLNGIEISVNNALGASAGVTTAAYTDKDEDGNDVSYKAGEAVLVGTETIVLNEKGEGKYSWTAGLPNITSPYARGISFSYEKDGKTYNWKPDGATEGLQAIILGELPSGTNILTEGPDRVLYVLRDPPGTNSSATWTSGSTTNYSESSKAGVANKDVLNSDVKVGTKVRNIVGTIAAGVITEVDNMNHIKINNEINASSTEGTTKSTSVTVQSDISTSGDFDFVGADGDVFVGSSTNLAYGNARSVALIKSAKGYSLGVKNQITMGSEFSTEFIYTQNHIKNTLIPNFITTRNSLFTQVASKSAAEALAKKGNATSENVYYTWIDPKDERYGSSNDDESVWGTVLATASKGQYYGQSYICVVPKTKKAGEAYTDKVHYYNEQIANWEKILSDNEEAKVKAKENRNKWLDKNFTFSAGASRTETCTWESSSGWTSNSSFSATISVGSENDIETNFGGVGLEYSLDITSSTEDENEKTETKTQTVSYTLSEDGDDDNISVDVYNAPDDFGPIFITRGGQTCAPYEGATYTEYYKPGTQLDEATMQIEIPKLTVGNEEKSQLISGVAIGKKANFTLHCKNESETGENCYFYLIPMQETISGGAILSTSQGPIGTGKFEVYVPAGETTDVVVSLAQNDQSILNYDNIGIRLASTSQYDPTGVHEVIDDTIHISAHFVAGSTDVAMKLSNNVMNIGSGTDLTVTVRDYDYSWKNLKAIRLQYRGERDADWKTAKTYVPSAKVEKGVTEAIPTDGIINYIMDMSNKSIYPDQTYYFRAQSATSTGATTEVTYESEIQTLVKDVTAPQIFGTPSPASGILTATDQISLTYNEDIKKSILAKADNFLVTAILNEDQVKHDVAIKFQGAADAAASTEADYNLANKSFSTDMWVNLTSAGTFFSHGNGTNKFTLGVDAKGHLVVKIADKTYTSTKTMPLSQWNYLAFSYDYAEGASTISALCAYDEYTVNLFNNVSAVDYTGNGHIAVGGDKIKGALQELSLWNKSRSMNECQTSMHQTKKPSTEGLIGYWKFNEGKDLAAADLSRSRSMVLGNATWYLNNTNYAIALTGKNLVNLNTSACSVRDTEDYALELWFKGNSAKDASKTLLSVGASKLSVSFDANSAMVLKSGDFTQKLGSVNYLDNVWHHFALNVLRNGSAIAYVDGTAIGQTSASNVKALASDFVTLGAERYLDGSVSNYRNYFTGSVDEVRVWKATLSAASIRESRAKRLSGSEAGLVAYYPFEYTHLDGANQVVTDLTLSDRISVSPAKDPDTWGGSPAKAADAPDLKPNITETNLNYSFVANERSIVITLDEDADRLDGTTVHFTVRNVSDQNGNVANPVVWSAYVKQNVLSWAQDNISLKVKNGEKGIFSATMSNKSGSSQNWSLSTLPSWLSADETSGTISALGKETINFTVSSAAQVGKYEETIYLTDNNGISVPLTVNINVAGEAPLWTVDANAFENYKPMVGMIKVKHVASEDDNDMVAAFIDGQCRGVASPVYESDYDAYFVNLRVYANSEDKDKTVVFKIWDASQCKIYPSVTTSPDSPVLFDAEKVSGSYKNPFVWDTDNKIEQSQTLEKGWNWISLYVHPDPKSIGSVFKTIASKASLAKDYKKYAQATGGSWSGSLTTVDYNDMYKVLVGDTVTFTTLGEEVDATADTCTVTVDKGWTWIGVNASYNMPLGTAFGGLSPQDGDVVKGQYGFATYDKYTWRGTLKGLTPGLGYVYMSNATGSSKFNYPSKSAAQVSSSSDAKSAVFENEDAEVVSHFAFDGASYNQYPDNMTVIGKVVGNAGAVAGAEVAIYDANGKIREMQTADADGIVFLTIPGNAAAEKFTLKVYDGEQEVTAPQCIAYANNAMYGTMDSPFIINAVDATGISGATLAGLKFYPVNPTSVLNVDSEHAVDKIVIYNVDGKMVNSVNAGLAQHNEINVSDLPSGVYQVMVEIQGFGTTVQSIFKK